MRYFIAFGPPIFGFVVAVMLFQSLSSNDDPSGLVKVPTAIAVGFGSVIWLLIGLIFAMKPDLDSDEIETGADSSQDK